MNNLEELEKFLKNVKYRDQQINLLFDLLIRQNRFLYPMLHLYGLSGTGKTFLIKKFMKRFCNASLSDIGEVNEKSKKSSRKTLSNRLVSKKYYVYLNCKEMCHNSTLALFHELVNQVQQILIKQNEEFVMEEDTDLIINDIEDVEKSADCSNYIRQLKNLLSGLSNKNTKAYLYLVIDNADCLKYFKDSANVFLMLCKLNEYLNIDTMETNEEDRINLCTIFVTEQDWHSLISDCDLMSRTETTRPFIIFFNEYNKDQMKVLLGKTAQSLVTIQYNAENTEEHINNVQFFAKIILDVFYPICKDLNEMQYLIQIYYDQVVTSMKAIDQTSTSEQGTDSYTKMHAVWNTMKPFLKSALNQIYLRNSIFDSSSKITNKISNVAKKSDDLSKEFESLNLASQKKNPSNVDETCNQLPRLMKFLLIASYIATHNPTKYDKKLFEYNANQRTRKTKFTAHKLQQTEENQRAAALKTRSFELNRMMAIFFSITTELNISQNMNLNLLLNSIKSLKSLHYLQQTSAAYTGVDEPKFKCSLDFETISQLSSSVQFNIKSFLAEYISI